VLRRSLAAVVSVRSDSVDTCAGESGMVRCMW
jgi:hypothetical protein